MKSERPRHFLAGAVLALVAFLTACSDREIPSAAITPTLKAWVSVGGQSMLPTYPDRALAEVEIGVPFDQLAKGDIVIFWDYTKGGAPLTVPHLTIHRLVTRQGEAWIAQGDNNLRPDRPWVTRDNYIARATGNHSQILVSQ